MATPADYLRRVEEILGDDLSDGELNLAFHYDTPAEAKQHLASVRQMQKELRLVKKEIGLEAKAIRAAGADQRAEMSKPTFGKGVMAGLFGKKAASQMNAARKQDVRQRERAAASTYEQVSHLVDQVLVHLDRMKLQLETWIADNR